MEFKNVLLALGLVFPFVFLLGLYRARKHPGNKSKRIVAEAQRAGRVSDGRLVKSQWIRPTPGAPVGSMGRNGSWKVVYEYRVNGRIYKWKAQIDADPPEKIDFYYPASRPHKAIPNGYNLPGAVDIFWIVLPIMIAIVFYNILIT